LSQGIKQILSLNIVVESVLHHGWFLVNGKTNFGPFSAKFKIVLNNLHVIIVGEGCGGGKLQGPKLAFEFDRSHLFIEILGRNLLPIVKFFLSVLNQKRLGLSSPFISESEDLGGSGLSDIVLLLFSWLDIVVIIKELINTWNFFLSFGLSKGLILDNVTKILSSPLSKLIKDLISMILSGASRRKFDNIIRVSSNIIKIERRQRGSALNRGTKNSAFLSVRKADD